MPSSVTAPDRPLDAITRYRAVVMNLPTPRLAPLTQAFAWALVLLFAGRPPLASAEDFRWEDAAKEVTGLPFSQYFIDSLQKVYEVQSPAKPLRVSPESDFSKGETLVYEIGWGPFKAGYVILTAEPDSVHHTIRLGGKALSNKFIGAFYRMRDYVISTVDAKGLYPLFFEQHLREGKHFQSDGWILYDHVKGKIYVKERTLKTFNAPPFINDYLSVLYAVRTMHFAPGDTFSLPLFADKKVHPIYFICRGRKTVQLDDGASISCLLVEPKLVGENGAFNEKDKLEVWLSDDERKMPILIKSKIKVGSITAKLVRSTAPNRSPAPPARLEAAPDSGDSTRKAPSSP